MSSGFDSNNMIIRQNFVRFKKRSNSRHKTCAVKQDKVLPVRRKRLMGLEGSLWICVWHVRDKCVGFGTERRLCTHPCHFQSWLLWNHTNEPSGAEKRGRGRSRVHDPCRTGPRSTSLLTIWPEDGGWPRCFYSQHDPVFGLELVFRSACQKDSNSVSMVTTSQQLTNTGLTSGAAPVLTNLSSRAKKNNLYLNIEVVSLECRTKTLLRNCSSVKTLKTVQRNLDV